MSLERRSKATRMNGVLKTALVIGVVISVEALVLRRLFSDAPWNVFVGAFLIASLLLISLQYALSKHRTIRPSRQWRRRPQQGASSAAWNGLDPPPTLITNPDVDSNDASVAPTGQTVDPALSDEDGIIQKENS